MKRINLVAMLALSFGLSTIVTSCKNEISTGVDAAVIETSTDESQAATINDGITAEVDEYVPQAIAGSAALVKSVTSSATLPIITSSKTDTVSFPRTVTINFGTGFTGKRGNVLKGKLIVVISDKMWKINSSKTITFDNFYINDNKVAGSKVITYLGLKGLASNPASSIGSPSWDIVVSDTITRTDGTVVTWNSERTRQRIDNGGTPGDLSDDKFSITGSSYGVNAKGVSYTMLISENKPLIAYNNYPHFVQGSVTVSTEKRIVLIDYGNGAKDNKATLTINAITKEITLKK